MYLAVCRHCAGTCEHVKLHTSMLMCTCARVPADARELLSGLAQCLTWPADGCILHVLCSMKKLYTLMSENIHEYERNPSANLVVINQRVLSNGQDVVLKCLADLLHVPCQVVDIIPMLSDEDTDDEDN